MPSLGPFIIIRISVHRTGLGSLGFPEGCWCPAVGLRLIRLTKTMINQIRRSRLSDPSGKGSWIRVWGVGVSHLGINL